MTEILHTAYICFDKQPITFSCNLEMVSRMAVACFKWNDPVVSRAGRILRFCARRNLRRIGHPVQNLGSCAELSKIDQLAQKMLDFVDFCWEIPIFLSFWHWQLQRIRLLCNFGIKLMKQFHVTDTSCVRLIADLCKCCVLWIVQQSRRQFYGFYRWKNGQKRCAEFTQNLPITRAERSTFWRRILPAIVVKAKWNAKAMGRFSDTWGSLINPKPI